MCDSTTAQHVNSVSYKADYFGHKLYVDQNGKLEIYGFVHVAAIDGHSRYNKLYMPNSTGYLVFCTYRDFLCYYFDGT